MSETRDPHDKQDELRDVTRRDFVAMSVAAGLVAASGTTSAQMPVVEKNVDIKMPDGTCDAVFIHPATGTYPGVLIWPDAFGLRPSLREMGKRLAAEGYAVLVPNPFYRSAKAPVLDMATFSFANPADRAKLQPLMGAVNAPGNPEKDAVAYIAYLDAQPQVDKAKKVGTQGYCMGGPLVMRTAAAVPGRVGAGASFHGGGLVTDKPEARICWCPRSARVCTSAWPSTTTNGSPTRRTSCAPRWPRPRCRARWRCTRRRCTAGACPICPSRRASRPSTTKTTPRRRGESFSPCIRPRSRKG